MEITTLQFSEAKPSPQTPDARGNPQVRQLWNSPAVPARSLQSWWIHLWSGFVRDPTAKHYKKMGNAVWLYRYLLISANRSDGTVLRRLETIALQTGYNERTVAAVAARTSGRGHITATSKLAVA